MMLFKRFTLAAAGAAACAMLAGQPAIAEEPVESEAPAEDEAAEQELTKGEEKLAEMLEGRVAGEPKRCIRTFRNDRLRVIDGTAYVYGSGKTVYVQRTKQPERIDRDDILVSRRFNATQLCSLDLMNTIDRGVGFFTGVVFFEEFVPYTRVAKAEEAS